MRKGIGTMVVKELITLVNVESNEILDEQLEYIQYINAAIDWLTTILVSIKDREVVKNTDIPNLKGVPSYYMVFVPVRLKPMTDKRLSKYYIAYVKTT